jgi:UDP-glucose 4-epimerase
MIANTVGHKLIVTKVLNWGVALIAHMPGKISDLANKAFGSLSYDKKMSIYDFEYNKYDLNASIARTEG